MKQPKEGDEDEQKKSDTYPDAESLLFQDGSCRPQAPCKRVLQHAHSLAVKEVIPSGFLQSDRLLLPDSTLLQNTINS